MDRSCYKHNFIKSVVGKIDFVEPTKYFTAESLSTAIAAIQKRFPISEQGTASLQNIIVTPAGPKEEKVDFPEWIFHGSDRKKFLKINQFFIEVLLSEYSSENNFKDDLLTPIKHLLQINPKLLIQRTGVRFVNIFNFDIKNLSNASEYFDDSISCQYNNFKGIEKCTRSLFVNNFIHNEFKTRVQTGFFNPDFPSIIKRNHFVIDIDAYIDIPHLINDTETYLTKIHDIIQETFESLIKDKLRDEVLNG
jgi:uncharacterized protein (TIGR04255 family)